VPSLREHGIRIGDLEPGPANAITDVPDFRVGHVTVRRDEPEPPEGRGVARTGVTALVPPRLPLPAGAAVLNGAGELTSFLQVAEWGVVETPVYLTATMAVGRVLDGAVAAAVAADPAVGVDTVVIPVVGECDDSFLSEARVVQVEADDAGRALAAAADGPVEQGAVGAGAGMIAFGWKGGIGSSSRVVPGRGTLGVLVLANFGTRGQLRVDGVPVGRALPPDPHERRPAGSCIALVAADAPLAAPQLERLARRAGLGLARTGSVAHHGSGEIFLALSSGEGETADRDLNALFAATVEATEEAVLNALWSAETTTGRDGRVVEALPHEETLAALRAARRN